MQLSFEFFPPKTDEQRAQLERTARKLKPRDPAYVSVTFGAGGSTLAYTSETVRGLAHDHGFCAAPHISCMGGTREEIRELLNTYRALGCTHLVALRGDMPSGMARIGELRYASDLVTFIRAEHGDTFHIEVGCYPECHPQADDAHADLRAFKTKIDAGADGAITQYFYNADGYFRFVDEARRMGIATPIVPGIMPITSSTQLMRFSDACGAEIPRWIRLRLQGFGDDTASIKAFGLDVVTELCARLAGGGAPAIHFYTMNQSVATLAVLQRLGWEG